MCPAFASATWPPWSSKRASAVVQEHRLQALEGHFVIDGAVSDGGMVVWPPRQLLEDCHQIRNVDYFVCDPGGPVLCLLPSQRLMSICERYDVLQYLQNPGFDVTVWLS
jgi:hypothetical protein